MTDAAIVYSTVGSRDEALAIARTLVAERLAACANVLDGMTSVYRWQGAMQEDREAILILKTRSGLVERVIERLRQLHSYECPAILSWPIASGHAPYLQWLAEQTTDE